MRQQFIGALVKNSPHQKDRRYPIFLMLFLLSGTALGQGRILGTVRKDGDGQPLTGANVIIVGTGLGAAAGEGGQFRITGVPAGTYTVEASFIGYEKGIRKNIVVETGGTVELHFLLREKPVELKTISVTPSHFSFGRETSISRRMLVREEIQSLATFGEDIYRAVSRLPGVIGNDFSAKFAVRGGSPEEVLVLYDGIELYDPFHMKDIGGGVLSIIDMAAIGGIDLITGGFTAEYGNKMSGVFDILPTDIPRDKFRTSIGLSMMNARLFAGGTFYENRGDWMVSARRGHWDLMMKLAEEENFTPKYYDVLGKIRYRLNRNQVLSIQFLQAGDNFRFEDRFTNRAQTTYGNSYAWMKLGSLWTPRLFSNTVFTLGRVYHDREATVFKTEEELLKKALDERKFDFFKVKQDWTFDLTQHIHLKWGLEANRLYSGYDYQKVEFKTVISPSGQHLIKDTTDVVLKPAGTAFGVYLSGRVRFTPLLVAECGLRYDAHTYSHDRDWSPRFNLYYRLTERTAIKLGWGKFYQSQGIHELDIPDGDQKYYPSELAEHRVAGIEHRTRSGLEIRIEAYQKLLSRIRPRYSNLIGTLDIFPELSGDRLREEPGHGYAKGMELYIKRDTGKRLSWWSSFCYMLAKDWILSRYVPRPLDQRVTLDFNINYRLGSQWRINVSWQYHSGWPCTKMHLVKEVDDTDFAMYPVYKYTLTSERLREGRLPDYHRMDIQISRRFRLFKGQIRVFFEIINLYNRPNIMTYDYQIVYPEDESDAELEIIEYNWLRMLPSAGISWDL